MMIVYIHTALVDCGTGCGGRVRVCLCGHKKSIWKSHTKNCTHSYSADSGALVRGGGGGWTGLDERTEEGA